MCYYCHEYGHYADHCPSYPDGHSSGGQSTTKPELTFNFRGNNGCGRFSHSFTSRGRGGGSGCRGCRSRGGDPTDIETENQITRKTDAVVKFVADESNLADEANDEDWENFVPLVFVCRLKTFLRESRSLT